MQKTDSHTLKVYEAGGGYRALRKAVKEMTPEQVTEIYDLHRQDMGEDLWRGAQASLAGPRDDCVAARWIVNFIHSNPAPFGAPSLASGDPA